MDDAFGVSGGEAAGHLHADIDGPGQRQRHGIEPRAQRLALEELRHDVERIVVGADVVDGENVGVAQRAEGLSFLLQPACQCRVV